MGPRKKPKNEEKSPDSVLRGTATVSKDLLNSVQEVDAHGPVAAQEIETQNQDAGLDHSIAQGLVRLRDYRERKLEEERIRIRDVLRERSSGTNTRSRTGGITRLHQGGNKFDPYQHPGKSMDLDEPPQGDKRESEVCQEDIYVVESDTSFDVPDMASTPAGNPRRGEKISSWADDSNSSAFSSRLDGDGKKKRKKNKRSRRSKRRLDEGNTSTNSEVRGANDKSMYSKTIRTLETSTQRLEREREKMTTIAKVVENANAAERAAVSAGLTPIKSNIRDMLTCSRELDLFGPPWKS